METPLSRTTLNNGRSMPMLGLGVSGMYGADAVRAITSALTIGYRLIDTAALYDNEAAVGQAVRESGIDRAEIFITTKVKNIHQGYDNTMRAFEESLNRLDCDYIDLYLLHWPSRSHRKETWRALETLYAQKRIRSIGVCNYPVPLIEELQDYAETVPAVNQVEFSPYLYSEDLLRCCQSHGIHLQASCPLAQGRRLDDPRLAAVAVKYGKTPAQIMLRWILQHGISAIPKSSKLHRMRENIDIFDFDLQPDDVARLGLLHEGLRIFDDPMDYV
ncbi:aldo/keto reductase [Nocardia sp. NEAU-G5]|uniref:Aldo/keto reductase n=2 Tax=Nocardia albiluteola TaxID=2842303 RepID=A0ABS6AT42_9NOCA|nr:aldo/keto reductase [Nocardia albiluteola]